jgi:hypothetical protein
MINGILAIWLLAIVVIAVLWPQRLLSLAIIGSVFEGAALLKFGGLAISPYYLTLLLVAARAVWIKTDAEHALGHSARVRFAMLCAALFAGVAVVGAFVLPYVFAGYGVVSPRLDADAIVPLTYSTSNLGQSIYLILNTVLVWYVTQQSDSKAVTEEAVNAILIASAIVIGLGLYQFAASLLGLPFPDTVLYSNDTYVIQYGTNVMDMPRICSTFTEPAGLAVFLLGITAFLTSDPPAMEGRRVLNWALTFGAIALLILSTSTTAYLGVAGIGVWRIGTHIIKPLFKGTLNPRLVASVLCVIAVIGATIASSQTLRSVVQLTVFEKGDSDSYAIRAQGNDVSTNLAMSTFGVGVGLGSNRASSFLPSMLSTVGLIGVCAFVVLCVLLVRPSECSASMPGPHAAFASGLIAIIAGKLISSPDLSSPAMWTMIAALIAVHCVPKSVPTTSDQRATNSAPAHGSGFSAFGRVPSTRGG